MNHPEAQGQMQAAFKRGFQTRDAELSLGRPLGGLTNRLSAEGRADADSETPTPTSSRPPRLWLLLQARCRRSEFARSRLLSPQLTKQRGHSGLAPQPIDLPRFRADRPCRNSACFRQDVRDL